MTTACDEVMNIKTQLRKEKKDYKSKKKQRIERGFCDADAWEGFTYISKVISGILRTLGEKGCGYGSGLLNPDGTDSDKQFKDDSEYSAYLLKLADDFDDIEYRLNNDDDFVLNDKEATKKNIQERNAKIFDVFNRLAAVYPSLWD